MTLCGENAFIFFVPPNEELEGTLHPQKFGCTPKNEGKRVHVPPDEKTCGHAGWSSSKIVSGSHALPPRWPPQGSCIVIESSFDPGERLQASGSLLL